MLLKGKCWSCWRESVKGKCNGNNMGMSCQKENPALPLPPFSQSNLQMWQFPRWHHKHCGHRIGILAIKKKEGPNDICRGEGERQRSLKRDLEQVEGVPVLWQWWWNEMIFETPPNPNCSIIMMVKFSLFGWQTMRLLQNLGQNTLRHGRVLNTKAGCGIVLKCTSLKADQSMKRKLFLALLL